MEISDEELLYLIMTGSEPAFYELYTVYYHLVWKIAREVVYKDNHIIDIEDIVAETLTVFIKLLQQYRSDKNASFRTYMKVCIKHRICTSMKQQYKIFMNDPQIVHLDDLIDDKKTIAEYHLKTPKEQQPDVLMMIEESVIEYNDYSLKVLSSKEKNIYKYMRLGYSANDISSILDIPLKSCYNAMYRISKKLSKFNMRLTSKKKYDTLK